MSTLKGMLTSDETVSVLGRTHLKSSPVELFIGKVARPL